MFPGTCAGHWLTPTHTLNQLKYRYEREVNGAQFPALRRILERDRNAACAVVRTEPVLKP
jgi:hypothetical protein